MFEAMPFGAQAFSLGSRVLGLGRCVIVPPPGGSLHGAGMGELVLRFGRKSLHFD